jgi:hypothetical protein
MYEKGRIDYETIDPTDRNKLEVQFESLFRQKIRRRLSAQETHKFRCVMIFLLPYYELDCWQIAQNEVAFKEKDERFWKTYEEEDRQDEANKQILDFLGSVGKKEDDDTIN